MPAWILEAGRTRVGPATGWGLLVFFGLPILAVLALVTVVGIPLTLALLAALGLIYALGYSASSWILGHSILPAPTAWLVASWSAGRSCGSCTGPDPGWPGLVVAVCSSGWARW